MNKKNIGITVALGAMMFGMLIPANAQYINGNAEAAARANAQQAAEAEAAFGEQMGIPRSVNQVSIQKKYSDTYNAQMNALGAQGALSTPSYVSPVGVPYTTYPYGYGYSNSNRHLRRASRILNQLF